MSLAGGWSARGVPFQELHRAEQAGGFGARASLAKTKQERGAKQDCFHGQIVFMDRMLIRMRWKTAD